MEDIQKHIVKERMVDNKEKLMGEMMKDVMEDMLQHMLEDAIMEDMMVEILEDKNLGYRRSGWWI